MLQFANTLAIGTSSNKNAWMFGTVTPLAGVWELRVETFLVHVWSIGAATTLTDYDDLVVQAGAIAGAWKAEIQSSPVKGFIGTEGPPSIVTELSVLNTQTTEE